MLDRMEFEAKINTWSEPEKFIAREIYDLKRRCPACSETQRDHETRINHLEKFVKSPNGTVTIAASGAGLGGGVVVLLGQFLIQKLLGG